MLSRRSASTSEFESPMNDPNLVATRRAGKYDGNRSQAYRTACLDRPKITLRCLGCGDDFPSADRRSNRMCEPCRQGPRAR